MELWMLIAVLGLIKLSIAALMLWIPFRHDAALDVGETGDRSDEDGGSRALPASPLDPRPRRPLPSDSPRRPRRRGPHGGEPLPSPARVRTRIETRRRRALPVQRTAQRLRFR